VLRAIRAGDLRVGRRPAAYRPEAIDSGAQSANRRADESSAPPSPRGFKRLLQVGDLLRGFEPSLVELLLVRVLQVCQSPITRLLRGEQLLLAGCLCGEQLLCARLSNLLHLPLVSVLAAGQLSLKLRQAFPLPGKFLIPHCEFLIPHCEFLIPHCDESTKLFHSTDQA